eukprot:COSAG06_NODE_1382_length_9623_cov_4.820559_5_plen_1213_part_00
MLVLDASRTCTSYGSRVPSAVNVLVANMTALLAPSPPLSAGVISHHRRVQSDSQTLTSSAGFTASPDCYTSDSGRCVHSRNHDESNGKYHSGDSCTVTMNGGGTIHVTDFQTESSYDYITLNGQHYGGSTGPPDTYMGDGDTFTWQTDDSVQNHGWEICISGGETDDAGCTNNHAINYDWRAMVDDGSCHFVPNSVLELTASVKQEVCLEHGEQRHPSWSNSTNSCPSLPGSAWPTDNLPNIVSSPSTPCDELPTVAHVCERAGVAASGSTPSLYDRATEWLDLAHDYIMQTANDNAAVITRQLCDEDGFESTLCIVISSTERKSLRNVTRQACVLADHLEKRTSLGSILDTNQLQPLQYSQYDQLFTQFTSNMQVELLQQMTQDQALEIMTTTLRTSAKDTDVMSSIALQRQQNDELMVSSYRDAIAHVQERISNAQTAVGVSEESLGQKIRTEQAQQIDRFNKAVRDANRAAAVAEVKQGVYLARTIFAAILAAPVDQGVSLVAAATSTISYLAGDKNVRDQGVQFLKDGYQLYKDVQTNCGSLEVDKCDSMLQDIAATQSDLERAISSLNSLHDLVRLNALLTVQDGTVSAADLPNVAAMGMQLGTMDAEFQVQMLHASADQEPTDSAITQLFSLMKGKVELMTDLYNTKLAAQDQALEHDNLLRRAQDVTREADGVELNAERVQQFYNTKLHSQQLVAAQFLMAMIRAYEFMLLTKYTHTERLLSSLRDARLAPADVLQTLTKEQNGLANQWQIDVSRSNNCGFSGFSMVDIALEDLPGNQFAQTGSVTLSLDPPQAPGYSHVVYAGTPRVYLVGLTGELDVSITFWKKSISTIVDSKAAWWTFTHRESNPALVFSYNPSSCETEGIAGQGAKSNLCDPTAIYMNPSPFGMWRISVDNVADLDLSTVTAIRFGFSFSGKPLAAPFWQGGQRFVFDRQTAETSNAAWLKHIQPGCHNHDSSVHGTQSCATIAELSNQLEQGPLNDVCCGSSGSHCVSGLPDSCSAECAAVLIPFRNTCATVLQNPVYKSISDALDQSIDLCDGSSSSPAPAPDCLGLLASLTNGDLEGACCSNSSCEDSGMPTQCSKDCADVFEPFFQQCSGWLKSNPMGGAYSALVPLITLCEDAEFGHYTGSILSSRCNTASQAHFLTRTLPDACSPGSTMPPMPALCTSKCATVFEDFYAQCHPSWEGNTEEAAEYTRFLALCQGL